MKKIISVILIIISIITVICIPVSAVEVRMCLKHQALPMRISCSRNVILRQNIDCPYRGMAYEGYYHMLTCELNEEYCGVRYECARSDCEYYEVDDADLHSCIAHHTHSNVGSNVCPFRYSVY